MRNINFLGAFIAGLMLGAVTLVSASGVNNSMSPYSQLPGGDLRVLEDWHPQSDPEYVVRLDNGGTRYHSLGSACLGPNETFLVNQWIGGAGAQYWSPVLETDRWAFRYSGPTAEFRVPFGRLQVSANEALTQSDNRTWTSTDVTWRCINQYDTRVPLQAKPAQQGHARVETGPGQTLRFEAHTPVIGAHFEFDTGKTCDSCYFADSPTGGTVTSGVLWVIYPDEIARAGHRY